MKNTWKNVILVSALGILLLGPCFATIPNYLASNFNLEKASLIQMLCFIVALSLAAGMCILRIRKEKMDIKSIGLFAPSPWYAKMIGVLTGIIWAVFTIFSLKGMEPEADILSIWMDFNPIRIIMMLIGPIGASMEDFVVRGFLMNQLKEAKVPNALQALLSALLFALYHSIWMVPIIGMYFLYGFFSSFIYGLLLAWLYFLGKRSLTPVMLSHGITVLVGEPILSYVLLKSFMF